MSPAGPESEVREALTTIQNYLSDSIPPLLAADSVELLLDKPADLVAAQIDVWITSQGSGKESGASYSDYLFHALRKLYDIGQFKLVPAQQLSTYLEQLKIIVVEQCPIEERETARDALSRLGMEETALASTVDLLRLPAGGHGTLDAANVGGQTRANARRHRRLSILLQRLEKELRASRLGAGGGGERKEAEVTQVVAAATANATTLPELRQVQEAIAVNGISPEPVHVFRMLGRSLPGWVIAVPAELGDAQDSPLQNSALEAMRQMVRLGGSAGEPGKRFEQLVEAAIEQFNDGSLARAVTILDLANSMASSQEVDAQSAAGIRATAHNSLDPNHLRSYADTPEKHHLLQKVLSFFHMLRPESLLDELQNEPKRDRRRLLLSLLEVHGSNARTAVFERLESYLPRANLAREWYFARNLVYVLSRIPRSEDTPLEKEIRLVASLLKPTCPAPLFREALADLGQIKHPSAEQVIIATVETMERSLLDKALSSDVRARLKSLLDRAILHLSKCGTPKAYRVVVHHGLKHQEELGDTYARLPYLAGQDLSVDEESVTRLLDALKANLPRRVLGVLIQKNAPQALHLIKALSSTPSAAVQHAFKEVSERFRDQEIGRAALSALQDFREAEAPGDAPSERLLGDLELFGLPDLLQQLMRSRLSGTLIIKDQLGDPAGTLLLRQGQMLACQRGGLEGEAALYRLLERPVPGTFVFMGHRGDTTGEEQPADMPARDLTPLIQEGLRRYDQIQHASAFVPDGVRLKPLGPEPLPRPEEDDPQIFHEIWNRAIAGSTPEECEAAFPPHSYQIRLLLARWVEEAVLAIQ